MSRTRPAEPRRVYLFSGHMVDRRDRPVARFPAEREGEVVRRLEEILAREGAGPADLGLCGGAAGGDLIFAETCVGRGVPLELLLPQPLRAFLEQSVDPSGAGWRERFVAVAGTDGVRLEVMAGSRASGRNRGLYSRHVGWLVERSLAWGADRLTVIALWDGKPGDGSGGTADLVEEARRYTERVFVVSPG